MADLAAYRWVLVEVPVASSKATSAFLDCMAKTFKLFSGLKTLLEEDVELAVEVNNLELTNQDNIDVFIKADDPALDGDPQTTWMPASPGSWTIVTTSEFVFAWDARVKRMLIMNATLHGLRRTPPSPGSLPDLYKNLASAGFRCIAGEEIPE